MLEIDSKTILEELVKALGPNVSSYTTITRWTKRFHQRREDLLVKYPNLQVKIFNWFDKLSTMIHIQFTIKLYVRLLSFVVQ